MAPQEKPAQLVNRIDCMDQYRDNRNKAGETRIPAARGFFFAFGGAHTTLYSLSLGRIAIVLLERHKLLMDEWEGSTLPRIRLQDFSKQSAEERIKKKKHFDTFADMMVSSQDFGLLRASYCLADSLFLTTMGCYL